MSLTNTISHRLFVSAAAHESPQLAVEGTLDPASIEPGEAIVAPLEFVCEELDFDEVLQSIDADPKHYIL